MRRMVWFALFLGIFLMSGVAGADEFYVIAGGHGVGTRITSVPYEIKDSGFYYLGGNLTYSGIGKAIHISADDVTLDLMGFSLSNGGAMGNTFGVYMEGRTNVEIRNGTVCGFLCGVFEGSTSANNHRAINIRATGNFTGIWFYGMNHLIKGCNASNSGATGLGTSSGFITDCVASNNTNGIRVDGPGNVLGNAAFNNSSRNFYIGAGITTAILLDQNSAFGLSTNYYFPSTTTGIKWGTNAGTP